MSSNTSAIEAQKTLMVMPSSTARRSQVSGRFQYPSEAGIRVPARPHTANRRAAGLACSA